MKMCSTCATVRPLVEFKKHRKSRDGLSSNCSSCRKSLQVERRSLRRALGEIIREDDTCIRCGQPSPGGVACPSCRRIDDRNYYLRNLEAIKAKQASAYRQRPAGTVTYYMRHRDRLKAEIRVWQRKNRAKMNALAAKRNAARIQRTPKWLTKDDFCQIEALYRAARLLEKETGIAMHVDHVLPLRGRFVSGLHVPSNLQVLTASQNCSKHNNWVPE